MNTRRGSAAAMAPCVDDFDRRIVATSAGDIEVATFGPDRGVPLILLSHGIGNWSSLAPVGLRLADRNPQLRIVAISRPGTGESPAIAVPAGDTPLDHEARIVLPAVMKALRIGRAAFLCHSDGAAAVLLFAALHPKRVLRIAAIAPYALADRPLAGSLSALPMLETDSAVSTRPGARHRDAQATYDRWRQARSDECRMGWSAAGRLAAMTSPLLIIQGLRDDFLGPAQAGTLAGAVAGPVNWVLLRTEGHHPQEAVPEQIVSLVHGHLAGMRTGATLRPQPSPASLSAAMPRYIRPDATVPGLACA